LQKFFTPTGGWHIKIKDLLYETFFSSKVLRMISLKHQLTHCPM
jgi:hypothetical protein